MLAHIVLFAPRPDLTRAEEDTLAAALERAVGDIPTVRAARVGRRIVYGQVDDALTPAEYPYVAILEFDDMAGLQAYLAHPAHQALGARFIEAAHAALVLDYDMDRVPAIRAWLDAAREPS